ncbi:MAG: HAMP domain-containing sensor histidine kinase, partial [Acidimicrobiales bacterium]
MRRRLFLVTLAVTSVLVAAFAFPLAVLVREVARDRAITDAEHDLSAVSLVAIDPVDVVVETAVARTTAGREGRFTVLRSDGSRIGDPTPFDREALALARDGIAFSRATDEGVDVYLPVVVGGTGSEAVVLRVRIPEAQLTEGVRTAWAALSVVALVLLVLSVGATDQLARSVTRPAADLARTSRALAGGDRTARAKAGGPPEIEDVADALNLLADRIDELLAAERERVADLSHRLRTPLTALRLDAEGHGAAALIEDVDRLEAQVSQLIRAARRPLHEGVAVRCDLAAVAAERAAFWGALAEDDDRAWSCIIEPPGPHVVRLAVEDAAAALDVLLGNVFAHTPERTPYAVHVTASAGRVLLAVEDGGDGIDDPTSVLDRGSSGGGSTGLGLDIAGA